MNAIFKGIRPLDYVLAALATAAGAFLMYENITAHSRGLRSTILRRSSRVIRPKIIRRYR